jgi:dipeptidyl aminopeptidase/acylaminoacyl peptidase
VIEIKHVLLAVWQLYFKLYYVLAKALLDIGNCKKDIEFKEGTSMNIIKFKKTVFVLGIYMATNSLSKNTIEFSPFVPHEYETFELSDQKSISKERYQEYVDWYNAVEDVEFSRVTYMSDNLKVTGFIAQPKVLDEHAVYPVIIYNRGGSGNDGKMAVWTMKNSFYSWVKAGYIVIASQYRGNDGGQGKEELSGADINDVVNLFKSVEVAMPYIDEDSVFMVGNSRGAMTTYQLLRKKLLPIKACAVTAGVADLFLFDQMRPDARPILEKFIPNMPQKMHEEFTKRSVMKWADEIKVPVLLMHGNADPVVDLIQSQRLSLLFDRSGLPHQLVIYPKGDHFLKPFRADINKRILAWFEQFKDEPFDEDEMEIEEDFE